MANTLIIGKYGLRGMMERKEMNELERRLLPGRPERCVRDEEGVPESPYRMKECGQHDS